MKRPHGSISLNCVDKTILAFTCANEPWLIHAIIDIEGEDDIDAAKLNQAILSAQKAFPIMRSILKRKYLWPFREIQESAGEGVLTVQDFTELQDAHSDKYSFNGAGVLTVEDGTTPQDADYQRNTFGEVGVLTAQDSTEPQDADYESYLFEWMNLPMDLGKVFPVRVLLLKRNRVSSKLIFTFHHSSTDALRACIFMRKVIETYNNGVFKDSELSEDIRTSRTGDELFIFGQSQRPRVKYYYLRISYSIFYRLVLAAIPFPARIFHDNSGNSRTAHLCNRTVGPTECKELEFKAASAGVELNDILLAASYRVVEKWNTMHGKVSRKIRVMAPVNISPKGFSRVLCNQVSWISIPTWRNDRSDPVKLLRKLRSEVIHQSMNRRMFDLIYFFYIITRPPMFITVAICKLLLIIRTHADSILFTNIGVVWPQVGSEESAVNHLGSSKIVNFTGSAIVVTPWRLSFGVSIYNKTLNVSLSYRPAMFSRDKAQQFLDLFIDDVLNYQIDHKGSS
jgi:NRPS condensation-like uncharacterized protein